MTLSLSGPEHLIASIPFLLGFTPEESAVVLWMDGERVVLTQRLDLPKDPADPRWHDLLWAHAAVPRSNRMVVVLMTERQDVVAAADVIMNRADRSGVQVLDIVSVRGGLWTSLLCTSPECCPPGGRPIPDETRTAVAAEFAFAGVASLGRREDVVASLDRDPRRADEVEQELSRCEHPASSVREQGIEEWRDDVIGTTVRYLTRRGGPATPATSAAIIRGLDDVRVRDTVLWTASHWRGPRLADAVARLADVVRAAPSGRAAPVATLYAGLAWLSGDGARASIALERALAEAADYSLAQLLAAAIGGGLDPEGWRVTMQSLSRVECRHGVVPVSST